MLPPNRAVSLRERVDCVLEGFLDRQLPEWSDADQRPVYDAVRRFVLAGGKRIRPAFCYWGWRGAVSGASSDDEPVIVVGAALELFHCFALIHDDIMDGSATRRGEPSMHEIFAATHTRLRWRGDPAAFGRHTALLCGDLCASWSDQLFVECGAPPDRARAAHRLFAATRAEAIAGQYLDLVGHLAGTGGETGDGHGAVERALQVARLKTARYTVSRPLQLGGTLGGADPELLASYTAYGDLLGETYQLRDDVLGIFGDPARTGKSVVDDLREGKPTVLMALAFERAGARELGVLRSLVGRADLDADGAARVREIVVATGALAATEELIERGAQAARHALAAAPVTAEVHDALARLTDLAVTRTA